METTQLRYFIAVAKTGKIATASQELFVTPPTISTSLAQLEKELGCQLFTRKANRLALNRQGEVFLEYAKTILDSIQEVQTEIQESLNNDRQSITVAVTSSDLWVDVIATFSLKYRNFSLSTSKMAPSDIMSGTFRNRFSFILAADGELSPRCTEGCNCTPLFDDYPVVAVHKDHVLASCDRIGLEALKDQRIIWPRANLQLSEKFYRLFREHGVPIPMICTYSYLICRSLVSQNAAVMLTTMHANNSCMQDIRFIPIAAENVAWPVCLYWREEQHLSDAECTFRDFVIDYYQE